MAVTQITTACRDKLKFKQTCIFLKALFPMEARSTLKLMISVRNYNIKKNLRFFIYLEDL